MNKGLDSLIEATAKGLREKNDFASRWCEFFTEDCIDKLKAYAETGIDCGYICEYCYKFKWVIDRAKHYQEKLNIPWTDILKSWEKDRNYWYLNYYQDANQPKIQSDKVRVFESVDEMIKSIGEKKFRCPACGGISTNPYECNSGIEVKGKKCNWKVYGFLGDLGKGDMKAEGSKWRGKDLLRQKSVLIEKLQNWQRRIQRRQRYGHGL